MSQESERPDQRRWRQGGFPLFGILLVAAGVILLLQTMGVLPWELWGDIWRLWPVILIAIGINVLLGRRAGWLTILLIVVLIAVAFPLMWFSPVERVVGPSTASEPLDGLKSADVNIDFGAGHLKVRSLPAGSANLMEGKFEGGAMPPKVSMARSTDSAELGISTQSGSWTGRVSGADWEISLSQAPVLTLNVDAGAANITLDIRDLYVTDLALNVGASNVDIDLPASAGDVTVDIKAGAADITIVVPEGVAAKIKKNGGLSSFDIDTSRFPLSGSYYVSPDFDTAQNKVTIDLNVGVSSVSIR